MTLRLPIFLLINGFIVWLASEWLPGVTVTNFWTAIFAGLVLGLVNAFIRPVVTLLTLPLSLMTFGLFFLLIQGGMVLLADWLVPGFHVDGFAWAMGFALFLALINFLIGKVLEPFKEKKTAEEQGF